MILVDNQKKKNKQKRMKMKWKKKIISADIEKMKSRKVQMSQGIVS